MKRQALVLFLCAVSAGAPADPGYWDENDSGWFWYQAHAPAPEKPGPGDAKEPAVEQAVADELKAHADLQKRLKETRIIAIMDPSFENVERHMRVQREVMDRAAVFADVWQRVVWVNPGLDYQFNNRPTNASAIHTWEGVRRTERDDLIAEAAKDHGLFFVFGPDCIHCDQMAATLGRFALRHGFAVQAIAVGNARHAAFPGAWADNGFVAWAGIKDFPALVLANVEAGAEEVFPVAYGPVAEAELENRIAVLTGIPVGERF